jgi:hypothetical protein
MNRPSVARSKAIHTNSQLFGLPRATPMMLQLITLAKSFATERGSPRQPTEPKHESSFRLKRPK